MARPDLGNERLQDMKHVGEMVDQIVSKTCPRCDTEKPLSEFGKHSGMRDGKQVWCKKCHAEHTKRRRKKTGNKYNRAYAKARHQATQTLIERHQEEFDKLLTKARKASEVPPVR